MGFLRPGELDRVVVVSHHLDDAVLGVDDLLAVADDPTVVTVFAGTPTTYRDPPSDWNRRCGFGPGDDVAAGRRSEDERALARLGAHPVHLPFVEHGLEAGDDGAADPPPGLVEALAGAVAVPDVTAVLVPLGLVHPEHRVVADAALTVRATQRGAPGRRPAWIGYAEIPYLAEAGALARRLGELATAGLVLEPLVPPVDPMARARKVAAFEAYASQVGPLDDWWSIRRRVRETPESLWRIVT